LHEIWTVYLNIPVGNAFDEKVGFQLFGEVGAHHAMHDVVVTFAGSTFA
jgi:hypothetical protein